MKKILFTVCVLIYCFGAFAQEEANLSNSTKPLTALEPPLDGYVAKVDMENRKVIPYSNIRQTDVAYQKRVWREIDLREKMNRVFASPKSRLIDILIKAIMAGELTAYDPTPTEDNPTGDDFSKMAVLAPGEVMGRFGGDSVLVEQFNENNEVISSHYEARAFSGENIVKFRIKEDWIFDKQRSVFEPRIVGIAPLITPDIPGMDSNVGAVPVTDAGAGYDPFDPFAVPTGNTGATETDTDVPLPVTENAFVPQIDPIPAFWIYFPEARHILVNKEVMNRNNSATGLSYDDVFIKRMFASYIIKEDNPDDLRIKDYISDGVERLYESERIKKNLMDWEQDLWSY